MPSVCSTSTSSFLRPTNLGSLSVPGNVFLAPLAGFTDAPFRSICVEEGADLTYTEMVSAEGLVRGGRKTELLLRRAENETLLAVQLFGSSPTSLARAAERVPEADLIDFNCGCPVPKVVKTGAGAALMRSPDRLAALVSCLKNSTSAPVTVKIRSGWDGSSLTYLEAGLAAEAAGAAMVCLHPRTRAQGYSGRADYTHIRNLKASLRIPVFGSGDLFLPADVARMFAETSCDGVMIARGALGNPFIFRSVAALAAGSPLEPVEPETRLATALRQLDLCIRFKGEILACREMRKHFSAYARGLARGTRLRRQLVLAGSRSDYQRIVEEYLIDAGRVPML